MKITLKLVLCSALMALLASCSKNSSCGTPSSSGTSTAVTYNSAVLNWPAVSGAVTYNLQYKSLPTGTWSTPSTMTVDSTSLTGLSAGTTYVWQVSSTCSSGTSAYTAPDTFTTLNLGNWSYGGTYYNTNNVVATPSALNVTALKGSGTNVQALEFNFTAYPTTSAVYNINNSGAANSVSVVMLLSSSIQYGCTGNDHALANVLVSPSGKISIYVSNVEVKNFTNPADSGAATNIAVFQP